MLTLELEPAAEGTRLKLAHTGFRGLMARMVSAAMGKGWRGIVEKKIAAVLDRMDEHGNPATPGSGAACPPPPTA